MSKRTLSLTALLTLTTLAACADPTSYTDTDQPGPELREVGRQSLRVALGVEELTPVGVTVEPGTGRRLVLDADRGIFALDAQGGATLVWGLERLETYDAAVGSAFTDIVAIDEGVFALTAISDGFLLDLRHDTLRQHFCYEPGGFEEPFEEPALQITQSVTYDAASGLIIAQPQTILSERFEDPVESQVATYDRQTGADLQWFPMPSADYVAGGMAMGSDGALLLGLGSRVDRAGLGEQPEVVADLAPLGVTRIEGMALDAQAGTLLVIDGATDTLVEVALPTP